MSVVEAGGRLGGQFPVVEGARVLIERVELADVEDLRVAFLVLRPRLHEHERFVRADLRQQLRLHRRVRIHLLLAAQIDAAGRVVVRKRRLARRVSLISKSDLLSEMLLLFRHRLALDVQVAVSCLAAHLLI